MWVMNNFSKALMITAIPIVVLSVVSAIVSFGSGLALIIVGLLVAVLVVAIVYTRKGEKQIAAGIWAGFGIGIVAFGVSCFAAVFRF